MLRNGMGANGSDGDSASAVAVAASRLKSRNGRRFKRKTFGASSEASFSAHSGALGFRVKSAFLVGRRGSPSTPMPTWKVLGEKQNSHGHSYGDRHGHDRLPRPHVSARKLAASLWELQEQPFSRTGVTDTLRMHAHPPICKTHILPFRNSQSEHANQPQQLPCPSSAASSVNSWIQGTMQVKQPMRNGPMGRHQGQRDYAKFVTTRDISRSSALGIEAISMKIDSGREVTTNELVKVLNHMWSLEERHAYTMSVISALRTEVEKARSQLKDLLLKESANSKEAERAAKHIAEERVLWQEEQEAHIQQVLLSIRQELDGERKSKRKLEALHKKSTKDLRDARKKLGKVVKELEKERRARELMEDICDELAREMGEDKVKVEELKRESLKVREEVEEERKMLQMAEVWREERVQMKLMEAKLELEEKNTAVDKLQSELEMFRNARREGDMKEEATISRYTYRHSLDASTGQSFADVSYPHDRRSLDSVGNESPRKGSRDVAEDGSSDGEEDLHSIDLNKKMLRTPRSNLIRQYSLEIYGSICNGRRSVDERSSTTQKAKQCRRNDQDDRSSRGDIDAERELNPNHSQVSQWIECSFKEGEVMEWGALEQQEAGQIKREQYSRSWQDGAPSSQETVVCRSEGNGQTAVGHEVESLKPAHKKSGPLNDHIGSVLSQNQSDWHYRTFDFQNVQSHSLHENRHDGFDPASGLSCQWNQQWLSPDVESSGSRGVMDGSLQRKLFETRLEGQQRAWKMQC